MFLLQEKGGKTGKKETKTGGARAGTGLGFLSQGLLAFWGPLPPESPWELFLALPDVLPREKQTLCPNG